MSSQRPHKLEAKDVANRLANCPGWELDRERLHRLFEFTDFNAAFEFMARVAPVAESLNHHPEWSNVYNRVDVYLTTHDADGITELDFTLAERMNELAR